MHRREQENKGKKNSIIGWFLERETQEKVWLDREREGHT